MKNTTKSTAEKVRVRRRKSPSKVQKFRRFITKRSIQRRLLGSFIVVAIAAGIIQTVLVVDAVNQLNMSYENFDRVYASFGNQQSNELTLFDFESLSTNINTISNSIATVNSRIRFVRPLAQFNNDWDVQIQQLDASSQLVQASKDMLNGLQPVLFFLLGESEDSTVASRISGGSRIVELLEIGRGQFLRASDQLTQAQQILDAIPRGDISPELLLDIETLEEFHARLASVNDLLLRSPDLLTYVLGLDEQRSYLLLATNNDEIRPSGGYLSTYGWIVVRDGRITDYDYSPTTTTSPTPPTDRDNLPFTVPEWWIQYDEPIYAAWDGSWYADFPSTAELAIWYYNNGNNRYAPVDGVISIDVTGFEYILGALGSVDVPGYNQVVNQSNFRDVVYDIRAYGQGVNPHKEFVADVFRAIFTDWQSVGSNPDKNNAIVGALLQGLQERHMMLYLTEPDVDAVINQLQWSGAQKSVENHDYLMVVDSNLGNKSNNSIIRQLTYDVSLQEDSTANSTLTIAYEYPANIASNDPAIDAEFHGPLDYGNLLQIYTPPGTTLNTFEGTTNEIHKDESSGYANFVTRFGIDYDTSKRLQLNYDTSAVIENIGTYERYRLLIQKQPGNRGDRVNIQITMPPNVELISSNPPPVQSYNLENLILDYRLTLDTDQWIEVTYLVR